MSKIKTGDEIVVLAGKDKGRRGSVLRVVKDKTSGKVSKLVVEAINMVKKHVKPNPQKNTQGGIIEKEAALDISNVAIWNPVTKKADRVGFKFLEDGKKVRYFKSNDEVIDV